MPIISAFPTGESTVDYTGPKSGLPSLEEGKVAYATDEKRLYTGNADGKNTQIPNADDVKTDVSDAVSSHNSATDAHNALFSAKQDKLTGKKGQFVGFTADNVPGAVDAPSGVNPNLLDNWYFGSLVNQRGQTEYTAAGYTVDRWKFNNNNGKIVLDDTGIIFTGMFEYAEFEQLYEFPENLRGKRYTASILIDSFDGEGNFFLVVQNQNVWDSIPLSKGLNHFTDTFWSDSTTLRFFIQSQSVNLSNPPKIHILAAKLELGGVQTLAQKNGGAWVLNEIPDFGEQLRRCTYYAEKVESRDTPAITNSTFVPPGATSAVFILPYARKRTVPAINFNDVSNYRVVARSISGETTAFSATAISLLDIGRTKAAILVSFNTTDQGYYCFLQRSDNHTAGYAFISADL